MANKPFFCSIVTPTETLMDQAVMYASLPAYDGQLGVISGASPMLTRLGVGPLRVDFPEGGSRWYLIEGGFAQIDDGRLNLLTDRAIPAERLSPGEADALLADARSRLMNPAKDDREAAVEKAYRDQQRGYAMKSLSKHSASKGAAI